MNDAPEILLAHHLKALKLPTFLREHQKLARQCATEGLDHVRYLGHVDKWRIQRRIDVMSMKPRKLSAVLS